MKLVLAHGVFDLFHTGHLHHLEEARKLGDLLLVSVVPDVYVSKRQPIYNEASRLRLLNALRCVNLAILCDGPGPEKLLEKWKPSVYVRNDEYIDQTKPEYALCRRLGISTAFTKTIPPHTSDIIESIISRQCVNTPCC